MMIRTEQRCCWSAMVVASLLFCEHGLGQEGVVKTSDTNTPAKCPVHITPGSYMITREATHPMTRGAPRPHFYSQSVLLINANVDSNLLVTGATMELSELRDDTGKDLLAGGEAGTTFGRHQEYLSESKRAFSTLFNLRSRFPDQGAKTLKTIKGKLILSIPSPGEPIRIDLKCPGVPITFAGLKFTFARLESGEQKGHTVVLTSSTAPGVSQIHRLLHDAEMRTVDGKTLAYASVGRVLKPGQPPELHINFKGTQDVEPVTVLLPDETAPHVQEYPFEYHDLPLPTLNAAYMASAPARASTAIPPLPPQRMLDSMVPLNTLEPSTVTLTKQERTVRDIVAEITRQTGNTVTFRKFGGPRTPEPALLTVEWNRVPFWQALENLCKERNLKANLLELSPAWTAQDQPGPRDMFEIIGPIRVKILETSVKAESTARYGGKSSFSDAVTFLLSGEVMVEPRLSMISHGCQVECCLAANGLDLAMKGWSTNNVAPPPWGPPHANRPLTVNSYSCVNFGIGAPLDAGELPSRLAHMRVHYFIRTFDKMGTIEIADPSRQGTYSLPGDLTLQWNEPAVSGAGIRLRCLFVRKGGLTDIDKEMLEAGKFSICNAAGVQLSFPRHYPEGERHIAECILPSKQDLPSTIKVSIPEGITTRAGWVDFHDIDVPLLPPPIP